MSCLRRHANLYPPWTGCYAVAYDITLALYSCLHVSTVFFSSLGIPNLAGLGHQHQVITKPAKVCASVYSHPTHSSYSIPCSQGGRWTVTDFLFGQAACSVISLWLAKVSGDDNSSFVYCVVQRWQLTLVVRPFEENTHCELDTKSYKFYPTFLLFSRTIADTYIKHWLIIVHSINSPFLWIFCVAIAWNC